MKKPPQELIDAFLKWYESNPHSKNEDYYRETITRNYLSGLPKSDFIDFFHKFAHDGGQVQSGGYRTSGKLRQTIETNYDQFRSFVLNPFDTDFDEAKWLARRKDFDFFGVGLATIYLNRLDKKRFPILNNKAVDSLALFDFWSAEGMQKSIRPDIIAHIGTGPGHERIIMDTKWKIPGDGKPGDADLQQMHSYNVQFGARRSFLLYPRVIPKEGVRGRFVHGEALPLTFDHDCGMVFLELFDGNKLRRDLGQELVAMLTSLCGYTGSGNHS